MRLVLLHSRSRLREIKCWSTQDSDLVYSDAVCLDQDMLNGQSMQEMSSYMCISTVVRPLKLNVGAYMIETLHMQNYYIQTMHDI
jgi:hypothetical protein